MFSANPPYTSDSPQARHPADALAYGTEPPSRSHAATPSLSSSSTSTIMNSLGSPIKSKLGLTEKSIRIVGQHRGSSNPDSSLPIHCHSLAPPPSREDGRPSYRQRRPRGPLRLRRRSRRGPSGNGGLNPNITVGPVHSQAIHASLPSMAQRLHTPEHDVHARRRPML
jgi:hypothetical protein